MDGLWSIVLIGIVGWVLASGILAALGGFDFIASVEKGDSPRSVTFKISRFVLFPMIILAAAIIAMFEIFKGGAR